MRGDIDESDGNEKKCGEEGGVIIIINYIFVLYKNSIIVINVDGDCSS